MKFHDTLNDKIWDLNTEDLIPEVKEKLEEIAEAFIEFLEIPTDAVLDKVITGSSASYNYNKYSDLDLHIIVDYDKVHEDCPLVNGYLNSLKKQFNDNHDITIHGVPVELYAEQKDQGTVHNGLYSLQTGWIDKPQKIEPTDNDAAVEAKFNEIKELVDKCDDSEEATELLEKIYNMRKAGLAEAGEFCTENLAFKKLRNEGCMDKLRQIKKEQIDKQLSLESYNEAFNTLDLYIDGQYQDTFNNEGEINQFLDDNNIDPEYSKIEIEETPKARSSEHRYKIGDELMVVNLATRDVDYKGPLKVKIIAYYDSDEVYVVENDKGETGTIDRNNIISYIIPKNESIKEDVDMEAKLSDYLTQNGFTEKMGGDNLILTKTSGDKTIDVLFWNQDIITVEYKENNTRIGARKLDISDDLKLQKAINIILIDPNTKKPFIESINEGQSIKKWAQSMLPEIFKLLRKNGIPSKDYCVLGHVEICPNANFLVRKSDVEKVLELLPMAKENEYWDTNGNAASIRIEYDGLREFEKTLKSVNEEYKAGDEITIDGKTGVIDSTFRFAEDDSLLGVWVKFGKEVKYYTLEELNDKSKNEEKEMNEDIKTEYAIINFLKKYGFATQEDLYNNIGSQVFVIDNAVKELLKQDKIKFEDGHGQDGINGWKLTEQIEEDLATLEKKVDKAEQDIQDIITSYTTNESIYAKLDETFKKALGEEVKIDTHSFQFDVDGYNISGVDENGIGFEVGFDADQDIKEVIEEYLDDNAADFFEEDGEITSTEVTKYFYKEEGQIGGFEFNIFFE